MRAKSDWAESQRVVEAAQAVAAQIDRHMPVAELAQRDVDCICDLRLEARAISSRPISSRAIESSSP